MYVDGLDFIFVEPAECSQALDDLARACCTILDTLQKRIDLSTRFIDIAIEQDGVGTRAQIVRQYCEHLSDRTTNFIEIPSKRRRRCADKTDWIVDLVRDAC